MRDPSMIASDPEISAWVAANAGAGKTYTLANRVARLLLADAKPQKILCLTFTKAAAAEMQDRLFKQLGEWAMLPDDESARRASSPSAAMPMPICAKARRLFAGALETPGGLKVLTLHAFCQIVLSRFPLEAGIPPAFEVLDDQIGARTDRRGAPACAGTGRLRRCGAGARPWRMLVTETSEATLTGILDAALGGDRRKLDRFFARVKDLAAAVRAAHGAGGGRRRQTALATDFCAGLARDIEQSAKPSRAGWPAAARAMSKSPAKLAAAFDGDIGDGFAALDALLAHHQGRAAQEAGQQGAGRCPARTCLTYLTHLQERYLRRGRTPHAPRAPPSWPMPP